MFATKEAERTVFLVNPSSPGSRFNIPVLGPVLDKVGLGVSLGASTGLGLVGSQVWEILERMGFGNEVDVEVVDKDRGESVKPKEDDLLLLSGFSVQAKGVIALIQEAKKKGVSVLVGGSHASAVPDDFIKAGASSFVGEAGNSKVFKELIEGWLHTGKLEQGVKIESEGVADPKAISLANLPVSEKIYRRLDRHRIIYTLFATVGCRYRCAHCVVNGPVRTRPVEEVKEEMIKRGLHKKGASIVDSDICAGGDDYVYELLDMMASLKAPRGISAETTLRSLDQGGDKFFAAFSAAQGHRLFVGVESPDRANLLSIHKPHNLGYDIARVAEIVENAHKWGIKVTALLMAGFPTETRKSMQALVELVNKTGVDDVNLTIVTPLPGSDMWHDFAAAGLFNPQELDTDLLDLHHLVYEHRMGHKGFMQAYQEVNEQIFAWSKVWERSSRAFKMSREYNLPNNWERQLRNSIGAAFLQAYVHKHNVSW